MFVRILESSRGVSQKKRFLPQHACLTGLAGLERAIAARATLDRGPITYLSLLLIISVHIAS